MSFRQPLEINPIKNSKNRNQIAAQYQDTTSQRVNFSNNAKKFTPQNQKLFRTTSYFGVIKIANPIPQKSAIYASKL